MKTEAMSTSETKRGRGRPRIDVEQHHVDRVLKLLSNGTTLTNASRLVGIHRSTMSRRLQKDQAEIARTFGREIKREESKMATNTTTPAEELAALVLQRAHESLDVEEGVPGAAARLAAIEDRIREVNATVERQALAEQERGRRAAEAQERERERQRQDEQSKIAKLDAALPRALADVEAAFQSGVVAIKKALALSSDRAVAQSRLRTLDGDERMHAPDGTASAITDRATHLLNREAGLSDVRSSSSYGLGEKPLGAK